MIAEMCFSQMDEYYKLVFRKNAFTRGTKTAGIGKVW